MVAAAMTEAGEPEFKANVGKGIAFVDIHEASGAHIGLVANPVTSSARVSASGDRTYAVLGVTPDRPFLALNEQGRSVFNAP